MERTRRFCCLYHRASQPLVGKGSPLSIKSAIAIPFPDRYNRISIITKGGLRHGRCQRVPAASTNRIPAPGKGVTQEELAAALGVTNQAVSKGIRHLLPDIQLLPALAAYFEVTTDRLLGCENRTARKLRMQLRRLLDACPGKRFFPQLIGWPRSFTTASAGRWASSLGPPTSPFPGRTALFGAAPSVPNRKAPPSTTAERC